MGGKDLTIDDAGRDALRRDVRPSRDLCFQAFRVLPSVGDPVPRTEWGTSVPRRLAPGWLVGSSRRSWLWFRVPYPARPGRSTGGNGDLGGGKTADCPGEGPVVELVSGVEVEEAAGRADAEDDAGRELERVGGDVGKVPEPGAGVVTSGTPPVVAGRL